MPRRGFFRLGILRAARAAADAMAGLGDGLVREQGLFQGRRAVPTPPAQYRSRPPGATVRFLELCTKCNDCVTACPAWAIRVAADGEQEAGYPQTEPNNTACAVCEDPLPCVVACETGALAATPRKSIRLGLARLDADLCVVPQGQACDFCVVYCPVPEDAIRMTEGGPMIIPAGCTGCGMCAVMCPANALAIGAS